MDREARFWAKVKKTKGCWYWTASLRHGYGQFFVSKGKVAQSHRFAWELEHGPIPKGFELDHAVCQEKTCVRPAHLELLPVAGRQNTLRHRQTVKRCKKGHLYTGWRTRSDRPRPQRECAVCKREWQRKANVTRRGS